ncbi:MAG TPA: NAD(P)H-dependent oxidoreductase [Candidatus Paceibacterota bacterium]
MLKIKVILGSTRQQRFGEQPAKWIVEKAKAKWLDVELLDLRDYPLPFFDEPMSPTAAMRQEGAYPFPVSTKWAAKIGEADGFIFVTPEYNHGYSAVMKNAFDYVGREWNKKPVGFVGYGTVGAARAVDQWRPVTTEQQMVPLKIAVAIVAPWMLPKNADGMTDLSGSDAQADMMLDELVWWADALKAARDKNATTK